jgi:hypothetical protein
MFKNYTVVEVKLPDSGPTVPFLMKKGSQSPVLSPSIFPYQERNPGMNDWFIRVFVLGLSEGYFLFQGGIYSRVWGQPSPRTACS